MTEDEHGEVPESLSYTVDHEWTRVEGEMARVGITAFATAALGDVVHVELPSCGSTVTAGEPCGEIESTKSVSDLYAPVSGIVCEVNAAVLERPELVNEAPYDEGWLFVVQLDATPRLLSAAEYRAAIEAKA